MSNKPKPERYPLTDDQRLQIILLATCTFLPGSYIKRFVRDIHTSSQQEDFEGLTAAQAHLLSATYYHYRQQIAAYVNRFPLIYPTPPPFIKPTPSLVSADEVGVLREEAPDWREIRRKLQAEEKLTRWRKSILGDDAS